MAYWRLHYHLVWGTYGREPMIDVERERVILGILNGKARELGLVIHAVGIVEDHVHVVVSIPPKLSVADCLRHLKGASSHALNRLPGSQTAFKWQDGYGAISIGERSLPAVIAYARNQKQHHCDKTALTLYERVTDAGNAPRA